MLLLGRGAYAWGIGRTPLDVAGRATGAIVIAAMAAVVAAQATGGSPDLAACAATAVLATLGTVSARGLIGTGRRRALVRTRAGDPALVVGCGSVGRRIAQRLLGDPTYGLRRSASSTPAPRRATRAACRCSAH